MSLLGERLLAVDAALSKRKIPHAFGGAIALGYCIAEPRGTQDLDVNIWTAVDRVDAVCDAMPKPIIASKRDRDAARRDGQVRLYWGETPIDVFFAVHEFHREISKETRQVPFEGATIDVLGCEALVVFKAMFNRTKDWADMEAIRDAGTVDGGKVVQRLQALLGSSDPSVVRLRAIFS